MFFHSNWWLIQDDRFAFGQLIATLALQVMHVKDPNNWLTPIFTQVRLLCAPSPSQ